jgi:hypothetical protein
MSDAGIGSDVLGKADFLDIFGSQSGKKAAQRQADIANAAYDKLKGVNTADMDTLALAQARKNFMDQMGFAKDNSPGAYAAYQAGDQGLADAAAYQPTGMRHTIDAANQSYNENIGNSTAEAERLAAEQAAEMLALKGTLSPEMQAELVRSGFGTAANSGGVAGSDAQRSGMARQLASDQLRVQAQRQGMASNLAAMQGGIRDTRNRALGAVFQGANMPMASAYQNAGAAGEALSSRIPQGLGVGGDTAVQNYMSNLDLENQKTLGKAGVESQKYAAQYAAGRAPIQGTMKAVGAFIGGYFGNPAGGAAAGEAITSSNGAKMQGNGYGGKASATGGMGGLGSLGGMFG